MMISLQNDTSDMSNDVENNSERSFSTASTIPGFLGDLLGSQDKLYTTDKSYSNKSKGNTGWGTNGAPTGSMDGVYKSAESSMKKLFSFSNSGLDLHTAEAALDSIHGTKSNTAPEEHGLLNSVVNGAGRMVDRVSSFTRETIVQDSMALSPQNMLFFAIVAGVGCLFMFLAFLTLPLLVFAPSKFALLFTLGSLCFLSALALLRGTKELAKHLIEPKRLPFTVTYFTSLFLTLYATLLAKSYVLTLVFSILQLLGLVSFLVSYIPGGTKMLTFIGQAVWHSFKKLFRGSNTRDLTLPI